ncbi:MAG: NAD(P)H-binding protein [bacterium]|nr:NAD(P)H-binding protein [bacterium]
MTDKNLTLVLGATGKTGRRVVERLQARQLPVRLGSRSAHPPFDWTRPDSWAAALAGVQAVYITFQPDLAIPGADETIRAFTEQAVASGVRRLVLLSGRGEDQAQDCEQIIQNAGVEWTVVRASWFNQNFNEGFMLDAILSGDVVLPVRDVAEPFIDVEDIADIVAEALTDDRHIGQVYEVTGPRLLTFPQAITEIAAAAGRDLNFVSVPMEAYAAGMKEAGVPEEEAWLVNYLFTTVLDGRNSHLTDDVERALGRKPRDFSAYVRETASTEVWNVPLPERADLPKVN